MAIYSITNHSLSQRDRLRLMTVPLCLVINTHTKQPKHIDSHWNEGTIQEPFSLHLTVNINQRKSLLFMLY